MDYTLTQKRVVMYITKDQKDLLDSIADILITPEGKFYKVNRNKYKLDIVRN